MSGEFWRAQADFFVRRVSRELSFGPDDVVLDVGCGNGAVIAALAPKVRAAHGADTSARNVSDAAGRYAGLPNLSFYPLAAQNYTDLEALPVRGVTRILCVSVLQYYKSLDEVAALIRSARAVAAPNCRMLLADLLVDYHLLKDICGVLLGGLESGTFRMKLREMLSPKHSRLYASVRAANPVLTMSGKDLEALCAAQGVPMRRLKGNITGNRFRVDALLELQ